MTRATITAEFLTKEAAFLFTRWVIGSTSIGNGQAEIVRSMYEDEETGKWKVDYTTNQISFAMGVAYGMDEMRNLLQIKAEFEFIPNKSLRFW